MKTRLILSAFIILVVGFSWLSPQVGGPNERTRLYLTESLFERGTLQVDEEVAEHGMLFDIAQRDGHYHTDKAPGMSLIALVTYPVFRIFNKSPNIEQSAQFARNGVMLPLTALALLAFFGVLTLLAVPEPLALLLVFALWVGTTLTHYAGAFYGHAGVAYFAIFAMYFALKARSPEIIPAQLRLSARVPDQTSSELTGNSATRHTGPVIYAFVAGLMCGATFAIEYQAAILSIALGISFLADRELRRPAVLISCAVGGLIPVLLTLHYNQLAFGGAFETSYQHLVHEVSVELHDKGFAGLTLPSASGFFGLIFSADRGVLATSPLLLLGLAGFGELRRRSAFAGYFCLLGSLFFFLIIVSTPVWMGGWSFGPRLLVPIYPLMGLASVMAIIRYSKNSVFQGAAAAFIVLGIIVNQLVFSVFPELPHFIDSPVRSFALPMLEQGSASPNLLSAYLGVNPAWSVILWVFGVSVVGIALVAWAMRDSLYPSRGRWAALLIFAALASYVYTYPEVDTAGAERFVVEQRELRALPNK